MAQTALIIIQKGYFRTPAFCMIQVGSWLSLLGIEAPLYHFSHWVLSFAVNNVLQLGSAYLSVLPGLILAMRLSPFDLTRCRVGQINAEDESPATIKMPEVCPVVDKSPR